METRRFRSLSPRMRALVATAVLLDGHEAAVYLGNDPVQGTVLQQAAEELSALAPEQRMPFIGTLLRAAIEELTS